MLEVNQASVAIARQPRGIVAVNGDQVPWESWEVDSNSTFDADTFRVVIPASAVSSSTVAQWLDGRALMVELFAGFPSQPDRITQAEMKSLIVGRTDDVSYDPVHRVIELTGRDLTGLLIDRKTTEKFANMTASAIVEKLAVRVGLKPVVTNTTALAGTYYDIDHARMAESMSEWELVCWLAHEEGFAAFVRGRELHFEPKASSDRIYTLRWTQATSGPSSFDGSDLRLSRNLTVAKDVTVTVRSWNAKKKTVVLATYPRSKHKGAAPGTSGTSQPDGYVRNIPGLTHEQAMQKAQAIHAEITAHEMKMEASMPADNELAVDVVIKLEGTGTPFDQTYYPTSIKRHMGMAEGYSMSVTAKNRAPDNQATL